MLKILVVIGTRPEAIKMAPVILSLKKQKKLICEVCVTAQHRDMLDQVLTFFQIKPDYDLNIMTGNQQLNTITAKILSALDEIYQQCKPDLVLVHGDTNTSFAAALAAFYRKIKIGHIEAGMRTGNLQLPFPEEGNRVLTTQISNYHFAPTKENVAHLKRSGVKTKNIIKTGNTVIDSLLLTSKKVKSFTSAITDSRLTDIIQSKKKIILVTGHRRENLGNPLAQICDALLQIANKFPETTIIYPVHPNPNVNKPVYAALNNTPNIILTHPLDYPDFVLLMKHAYILLTDSGGIQEEGPSLGKPVLVLREITERPEALKAGTVKLVGTKSKNIVQHVSALVTSKTAYQKMSLKINPYGDGNAAARITKWIKANAQILKKTT
ncbi:MAG: UDP-N-acetylglucosamine 2-epimerase (non-hydrolyzing) [Chitinophagales bacterium]|jgi:UDP-N-acetylglucosamine 2-epimerase (non-hydrolysing)|nr:UDP-N-acetylglucosamine 2-epimerase (non-hydrolyzing) [Bacteroidota bacterium]MBK9555846.1 UDP-N-acetylglucosamine 2-epimerase (non-hydrolyzing) [Bacteroidota bacterium]MBL0279385.1 UDP-N-acetylglucosamine 2-epimerase (non-hydrolyzing) [Bacteroidota bacterium]MBP9878539.1 UDP-N-acetylglucosamine 2-epimerase (non-hydrolyzing) [Chitinophagales bacterium]